jgi:hypothetical protein
MIHLPLYVKWETARHLPAMELKYGTEGIEEAADSAEISRA